MTKLNEEIDNARHNVRTDNYSMSIGELASMYSDGELEIHPAFQRVFRWSDEQKSNFIESIFLGIPIPSIFVAQREDGVWDLVDGLQRLSTIFSFMNKLKDAEGNLVEQFVPQSTKYLPSLKNIEWETTDTESNNELPNNLKLLFKRQKIAINIIEKESDNDAKFELFQRLNTGGSKLSDQEVRNCLLIMLNNEAFETVKELSEYQSFRDTIPITENKEEKAYYYELVLRFFINRNPSDEIREKHTDVHPYLNAETIRLFDKEFSFDYAYEENIFKNTFDKLSQALDENAFKKYNKDKERYLGPFSLPVFEAISTGLSLLLEANTSLEEFEIIDLIQTKSKDLVVHPDFIKAYQNSSRPIDRTKVMLIIGKEMFSEN